MSNINNHNNPDELAADNARQAAINGAWEDFATPQGETPSDSVRSIQERAITLRESERFESELYNDEELFGAIDAIRSGLKQELQESRGNTDLLDDARRDPDVISADERALILVRSSLRDGNSFEAAKDLIAKEIAGEGKPALAAVGETSYGAAVWSGTGAKNVGPDGSLSPLPRHEDGGVVLCEDYYVARRAQQFLDYFETNAEEVKAIASENPEVPSVFKAPLFEDESGGLHNQPPLVDSNV